MKCSQEVKSDTNALTIRHHFLKPHPSALFPVSSWPTDHTPSLALVADNLHIQPTHRIQHKRRIIRRVVHLPQPGRSITSRARLQSLRMELLDLLRIYCTTRQPNLALL
jgi:hypothetical protein